MKKEMKDKISETLDITLETGSQVIGSILADTLIGTIVPGVSTAYLAYKQQRMYNNILKMIECIKEEQTKINNKLAKFDDELLEKIKCKYLPFILDNIIDEVEEEKIQLIINGFVSILDNKLNVNEKVLIYYDVLNQLRFADIIYLIHLNEIDYITVEYIENKTRLIRENNNEFKQIWNLNREEENYIESKLQSIGLISTIRFDSDERVLNDFGRSFINFFQKRK
ncbi:hypothetical protein CF065_18930 [Clostridium sporogenes]|uniref:hypothetical protein n=1 Tax=Clostridium botulinum TaxID=1491 RepID=UPI003DA28BCB